MKLRSLWLALPACAVISVSCDNSKKETPSGGAPAVEQGASSLAPTDIPALSGDERAAKFGIVRHLPQDTDFLFTVYDGEGIAERAKKTKLWNLLKEESGILGDPDSKRVGSGLGSGNDSSIEEVGSGIGALLGHEVFIALGKSSDQLGNLAQLNNRSSYFQGEAFAQMLVAALKGDFEAFEGLNKQMYTSLLQDPEVGVRGIEKLQMVPLYVGFKTSEADREQVSQQVASAIGFLEMFAQGFIEPVDFESGNGKFTGYRLIGEKFAAQLKGNRAVLDKAVGVDNASALLAALEKKDVVVASGMVGEYVILFMGSDVSECKLVAGAGESLAASSELRFADAYADKDLMSLGYSSKALANMVSSAKGGSLSIFEGFKNGLSQAEGLGDTTELQAMLQTLVERGQALNKLSRPHTWGAISYFEDGFKLESFGGVDSGAIDWNAKNRLKELGDNPEVFFFANYTSDAEFQTKLSDYLESIVGTGYAIATKAADSYAAEDAEAQEILGTFSLFDAKFRPDVAAILNTFNRDLNEGLGKETAVVMDLKGAVPTVPGIPQEIADQGKFIRASFISPVADRSKIQASWKTLNQSTTNILKSLGEMGMGDVPMQKPLSSEKNDFTTWFFPMPFFNDDFVPSVTISDKWFITSTSKVHALELGTAAEAATTTGSGLTLSLRFDPIRTFVADWLKLLDENGEALMGEDKAEFDENKTQIEKVLKALEEWDRMDVSLRRENDIVRGSLHFKTR